MTFYIYTYGERERRRERTERQIKPLGWLDGSYPGLFTRTRKILNSKEIRILPEEFHHDNKIHFK